MKIYPEFNHIVFECDSCHERLEISAQKSKRGFMLKLNKFARVHDNTCKWNHQRKEDILASKVTTDEITGRLLKVIS